MFSLLLSSAYTEPRPLLFLTPAHQPGGWGCTRSWEGAQMGQVTPTGQRDTPYHVASCSAYKAGRRTCKGGAFRIMAFVFPSNCYVWWSSAFLAMAWWGMVNGFLVLPSLCVWLLLYLLNCVYLMINAWVFSHSPSRCTPTSHWGKWALAVWYLVAA